MSKSSQNEISKISNYVRFAIMIAAGFFFAQVAFAQQQLPNSANTITLQTAYPTESNFFIDTNTVIGTTGNAIAGDSAQNWTITNFGVVASTQNTNASGILLNSTDDNQATVYNYGLIISSGSDSSVAAGVRFTNGGKVVNYAGGVIQSGRDGVHSDGGTKLVVENYGTITGSVGGTGVYSGEAIDLYNHAGGIISSILYGVHSNSDQNCVIINEGLIQSQNNAAINLTGSPSDYLIHNKATGIFRTTGGSSVVNFSGERTLLLNQGLIENTSNNASNSIITTATNNDIIVNAGTMTASGATAGVRIQGSGSTFYNIGVLNAASGNAVEISGANITVVLGQYFTMQNGTVITGFGSNITGTLTNTGMVNNKIMLQDSGSEDDDFTDFQSLVMRGQNWTLSNTFNLIGGQNNDFDILSGQLLINGDGFILGGTHVGSGGTLLVGDILNTGAALESTTGIVIDNGGAFGGAGTFTGNVTNSGTIKSENFAVNGFVNNLGVMDLRGQMSGNTLTINGSYQGNSGSSLILNILFDAGSPVSDILAVNGGTITGVTDVYVHRLGGKGGAGMNIAITDLQSGATSDSTAFKLANPVTAGVYEYGLFQNISDQNWYLAAIGIRPETLSYVANIRSALSVFVHSFSERNNLRNPSQNSGVWVRMDASSWKQSALGGTGKVESDDKLIQAGADIFSFAAKEGGIFRFGAMAGYAGIQNKSEIDNVSRKAKGSADNMSAGVYGTWLMDEKEGRKLYADFWFQYGWQKNIIGVDTPNSIEYNSNTILASAETGYAWDVLENQRLVITPQMQVTWSDYQAEALSTSSSAQISDDVTGSLAARYGLRVQSGIPLSSRFINPFMEMNWLDDSGNIEADFNGEKIFMKKIGSGLELKLGLNSWITDRIYASLDIQGQSGQDDYRFLGGNLSLKYIW